MGTGHHILRVQNTVTVSTRGLAVPALRLCGPASTRLECPASNSPCAALPGRFLALPCLRAPWCFPMSHRTAPLCPTMCPILCAPHPPQVRDKDVKVKITDLAREERSEWQLQQQQQSPCGPAASVRPVRLSVPGDGSFAREGPHSWAQPQGYSYPTTPPCADTYVNCSVAVDDNNSAKVIYRCNPGAKLDHKNAIVGWVYRKVG